MKENVFYVKLNMSIPVPIKMYQAPGTERYRQQQQVCLCVPNTCVVNVYFSVVLPN